MIARALATTVRMLRYDGLGDVEKMSLKNARCLGLAVGVSTPVPAGPYMGWPVVNLGFCLRVCHLKIFICNSVNPF